MLWISSVRLTPGIHRTYYYVEQDFLYAFSEHTKSLFYYLRGQSLKIHKTN
jgi:hypothetical protein